MRNRRPPKIRTSHDRWLVSYADFITLLFAFFVVLYSAAEINKKKTGQVAEAIHAAFDHVQSSPAIRSSAFVAVPATVSEAASLPKPSAGTLDNDDLRDLRKDLERVLSPEISRGEADVRATSEGLVISLREIGFFQSGSAEIKPNSRLALSRIASLLSAGKYKVRIEGHTDNVPVHNSHFHSNWELSTSRATEMVRLLIVQYQLSPQSLSAAGFAEYHPIASNENEKGRGLNRRVDVVVLGIYSGPAR